MSINSVTVCISCLTGYRLLEGGCIPIVSCPSDCVDCIQTDACRICAPGTVLIEGVCVVGNCPQNCSTCQNFTVADQMFSFCSSCVSDDYALSGGVCRYDDDDVECHVVGVH